MTKNAIIEQLFKSKNFNDCLNRMEPEHLREDLKSEVILIICEHPDEKIIGLHERKELEFYTVRIILNLIKSDTSYFFKKYRLNSCELNEMRDHPINEINEIIDRAEREQMEDIAMSEVEDMKNDKVNNRRYYVGNLIALYMKFGNYRAIEDETKIPFVSCYKTIKQSFVELRQKANRAI